MPSITVENVFVDYDQQAYATYAEQQLAANGYGGPGIGAQTFTGPVGGSVTLDLNIDIAGVGIGATTDGGIGGTLYVTDDNVTANNLILSGTGSDVFLNAPVGGGTIVGGGADTVVIGGGAGPAGESGAWNIVESGSSQIFLTNTTADNTVTIDGADTVVGGDGNLLVYGSNGYVSAATGAPVAGASQIFAPAGGATLTYIGADGADTVVGNAAGSLIGFGGTGPNATTYWLADAPAMLINADGNMVVHGATGANAAIEYFGAAGSDDTISAADGRALFTGTLVFDGAANGNQFIDAFGATGNGNQFFAGNGDDYLIGGAGNDSLVAGAGDATLTGGAGNNVFAIGLAASVPDNAVTVTDFNASDLLELLNSVTIINEDLTSDPGNLVATLSDSTKVTFTGLTTDIPGSQIFNF